MSLDGMVNLGKYGQVYVAGKTVEAAKKEIEKHLSGQFKDPEISLDIFVYNSKFYYVIVEGESDQVARMPITGNETVLDAIAQIGGFVGTSKKSIWVSRPSPQGQSCDQILPVDFDAITRGAATSTNYQLMPGDRLFVSDKPAQGFQLPSDEATARLFNATVKQRQYFEAIAIADKLHAARPDSEVSKALQEQSKLLKKQLEFDLQEEMQETAELISQIREQRSQELKIRKALRKKVKAAFDGVPLAEVVDTLSASLGVNILVDKDGLAAEGVPLNVPITLNLKHEISASSLLTLMLEPYRLSVFNHEGVLKITSSQLSEGQVTNKTYRVDDVVGFDTMKRNKEGKLESGWFGIDSLVKLITATTAPQHWDDVGGPGTVQTFGDDRLVVSASRNVHAEIEELLAELRSIAKRSKNSGKQTIENIQRFPEGFKSF